MYSQNGDSIVTYAPGFTNPRWLGRLGHVSALQRSYILPGGCDKLSCTLQINPTYRPDALDPARLIRVFRGASVVWTGTLEEPSPSDAGWNITATGNGHFGDDFVAIYNTWNANDSINQAISRGLLWRNPGITASALFLAQQQDSGTQTITDFLNLITSPGNYTWTVTRKDGTLSVITIPSVVTRLLVVPNPAARTLSGYINAIVSRFQSSADTTNASAAYGVTTVVNQANVNKHGRREIPFDLSGCGVMTAASAQAVSQVALLKYQATNYSESFTVQPGQYLTPGGTPVDLGMEKAGEVAQLLLVEGAYGGEVLPSPPVTFPVGAFTYDDVMNTASVTPFGGIRSDLSSILNAISTVLTPVQPAA